MGRILCFFRKHTWGPLQLDERRPYRVCDRCGRFQGSSKMGPDGYDEMPPQVIGGTA